MAAWVNMEVDWFHCVVVAKELVVWMLPIRALSLIYMVEKKR